MSQMTIREALLQASSLLTESGVEDGRHESELLLLHLLQWERSRLLLDAGSPFPQELRSKWETLLTRRRAGEPAQYIIGEQEFYGLPFEVNSAVLIPRPETELLVEAVVNRVRQLSDMEGSSRGPLIADIGTGSGAIAVTLLSQLPSWRAAACDISPAALQVAMRNATRNGVGERVSFYEGDLLGPLIAHRLQVDVLVSNPPYIETADMAGLQREVRDYEPSLALDGGADGLRCYREIVAQMNSLISLPRVVGFEVGQGQAREVASLLEQTGCWAHIEIVLDYAGIERHVIAWR